MSDIVEFLLARIAEDQAAAQEAAAAAPVPWEVADRGWMARLYRAGSNNPVLAVDQEDLEEPAPGDLLRYFERMSPTRMLAECATKRHLIAWYGDGEDVGDGGEFLTLLALPYAGHPDYRQGWTL